MMKNLLVFVFIAVAAGCSKHKDPGFTSAEGKWTYSTSDSKIIVTFELVKSGSGLSIQNPTIKVDGTAGTAASTIAGVILPSIQKIRINANDANLVYPYAIEFNTGVVSGDFKTINFSTGTYTWPYGTVNSLTTVTVVRL